MYSPTKVALLADNIVNSIASEDDETRTERRRLTEKLDTLKRSLDRLHGLDLHNLAGCHAPVYDSTLAN